MSHIWWSRVINMKESCHTYKSYMKESCHTHDMNSSYMWHDLTWILHICDMSSSYMRLDFFMCVTWLLHIRDMTHPFLWRKRGAPFHLMCTMTPESVAWLFHICDMTPSYVWCDSHFFARQRGVFSPSYAWHDSFIRATWIFLVCATWLLLACVTWLRHLCEMPPWYMQHDSFMCACQDAFTCVTPFNQFYARQTGQSI